MADGQPGERRRARRGRRAACARRSGTAGTSVPRSRRATARPPRSDPHTPTPGAIVLRSHCSDPAADSITPIACQAPGTAWQNACTRPSPSAANRSKAANTTPEVPSATDSGPGRSTPTPTAPAAWSPAPAATGIALGRRARHRRALEHRWQPRRIELQSAYHFFAPGTSRDVEQQRAGSVGDVGRVLAAQAQAHVVLGKRDPRDLREHLGLVAAQPQELRRGEPRQRPVARERRAGARARSSARSRRTRPPSAGRSTGSPGAARGRSRRARPARASAPTSPIPAYGPAAPRSSDNTASVACHQSAGSCSAQPTRGVDSG